MRASKAWSEPPALASHQPKPISCSARPSPLAPDPGPGGRSSDVVKRKIVTLRNSEQTIAYDADRRRSTSPGNMHEFVRRQPFEFVVVKFSAKFEHLVANPGIDVFPDRRNQYNRPTKSRRIGSNASASPAPGRKSLIVLTVPRSEATPPRPIAVASLASPATSIDSTQRIRIAAIPAPSATRPEKVPRKRTAASLAKAAGPANSLPREAASRSSVSVPQQGEARPAPQRLREK